jgi:general secretion pathway protein C
MQDLLDRWTSQSPEQMLASASERLPFWISLLVVALIAYYLARLIWLLYPAGDEFAWSPPARTGPGRVAAQQIDYQSIVGTHLFGKGSDEAIPVPDESVDAPDTRLNLRLRATIAANDPETAHAIIADGSGNEKVYFLKDSVPGGATLHRVHRDRVILNRGGVLESLRLPKEFESRGGTVARSTPRAPAPAPSVQEVVAKNAATFMEIVRPQPFMPGGQLKGYRVYPGRNRQQFSALGLRPGDLVTEIEGTPLNNPAEAMQTFRSLGDSTTVSLTIERNGQSQSLTIDTSQVGAENVQ